MRRRLFAVVAAIALAAPFGAGGGVAANAARQRPNRVLIVLFDQMVPGYADQFDMPNFRALRDSGTDFKKAILGYMASETVIAHNVITSGQLPKNMGWVDEAYRDAENLLPPAGPGEMHITGDLSLDDYGTLIEHEGYPKLADYLHEAFPGTKSIVVGEKSYAVESAVAPSGDIGVRMSSRSSSSLFDDCRTELGGRYRFPTGKNVPTYLAEPFCNRWYINSDSGNAYGTNVAFPSWIYPEDGNRFFPGTDASAATHAGGDVWVADAAIEMIEREDWSGMFVTLGGIDKAGHMWGAQHDAATFMGDCNDPDPVARGAAQTHVRCAAEIADEQFGRILDAVQALDASDGGETLVVLTADHGATYGQDFLGKQTAGASDSNWYWAPNGVWDAGAFVPPSNPLYNTPSPALLPLDATDNVDFTYASTAIETWLVDHSEPKMKETAGVMLTLPEVTASYWRDGGRYRLFGTNPMTKLERKWWEKHGQALVNTMASPNGPDVIGLLHDKVGYGAFGDHGGHQESVQQVPMVFWSEGLSAGRAPGVPFTTPDVLPTILKAMGIPLTEPMDGRAWNLP
ncbi:MAG TPA: alkaline phosphatase family protein [Actinomycetota bacterium]|jgi:hypothetical protein|nr:alkaline phosphatase family protein [Actinomycetota bacterium]